MMMKSNPVERSQASSIIIIILLLPLSLTSVPVWLAAFYSLFAGSFFFPAFNPPKMLSRHPSTKYTHTLNCGSLGLSGTRAGREAGAKEKTTTQQQP